jgi:hypothetical protein
MCGTLPPLSQYTFMALYLVEAQGIFTFTFYKYNSMVIKRQNGRNNWKQINFGYLTHCSVVPLRNSTCSVAWNHMLVTLIVATVLVNENSAFPMSHMLPHVGQIF